MPCSVPGCHNRSTRKSKKQLALENVVGTITFHRLPKQPGRRAQWIMAVKQDDWIPPKVCFFCSQHFEEKFLDKTSLSCVRLKDNAVPTIFTEHTPHLQMETKKMMEREEILLPEKTKSREDAESKNIQTPSEANIVWIKTEPGWEVITNSNEMKTTPEMEVITETTGNRTNQEWKNYLINSDKNPIDLTFVNAKTVKTQIPLENPPRFQILPKPDATPSTAAQSGLQSSRKRKKLHPCNQCGKVLTTRCNLTVHLRSHTGEKPFSCLECKKTFTTKGAAKIHMHTHTGEKPFSCPICGMHYSHSKSVTLHMRSIHSVKDRYQCGACNETFKSKNHLKQHQVIHTGVETHVCSFCNKQFPLKSSWRMHIMRLHSNEGPFTCPYCEKLFKTAEGFKRHKLRHEQKGDKMKEEQEEDEIGIVTLKELCQIKMEALDEEFFS